MAKMIRIKSCEQCWNHNCGAYAKKDIDHDIIPCDCPLPDYPDDGTVNRDQVRIVFDAVPEIERLSFLNYQFTINNLIKQDKLRE